MDAFIPFVEAISLGRNHLSKAEITTTLSLLLFLLLLNLPSSAIGVIDGNTTANYINYSCKATLYLEVCYTSISCYSSSCDRALVDSLGSPSASPWLGSARLPPSLPMSPALLTTDLTVVLPLLSTTVYPTLATPWRRSASP
ncbi:unnamed protein product [Linum trigynum]|uniref:Uncharacterized protein n=1 Tax=Linum trigynum TaxID=586398 RepID=A0AAV2E0G4_9ROSI